jgi:uncharacterized protein (DUF1015 family)
MIEIDELIQSVLLDASKSLSIKKKRRYKRRVSTITNDLKNDMLPYSTKCNYNWFSNWINRRENKNLMTTKQSNFYMVYNRITYELVLCYNMETSEVLSSFDISTIPGLQKNKT